MKRMDRIAQLERASCERSLTEAELDELEQLQRWRNVRLSRLPHRIDACHAKLERLHRELAVLV